MRRTWLFTGILLVLFTTSAFAFSWGSLNPVNWIKGALESGGMTVAAAIITFILGSAAIFGTIAYVKIVNTLKESGEFLTVLGNALADRNVTPDEIRAIVKEARDVFNIWRKTPEDYKPE